MTFMSQMRNADIVTGDNASTQKEQAVFSEKDDLNKAGEYFRNTELNSFHSKAKRAGPLEDSDDEEIRTPRRNFHHLISCAWLWLTVSLPHQKRAAV